MYGWILYELFFLHYYCILHSSSTWIIVYFVAAGWLSDFYSYYVLLKIKKAASVQLLHKDDISRIQLYAIQTLFFLSFSHKACKVFFIFFLFIHFLYRNMSEVYLQVEFNFLLIFPFQYFPHNNICLYGMLCFSCLLIISKRLVCYLEFEPIKFVTLNGKSFTMIWILNDMFFKLLHLTKDVKSWSLENQWCELG